MAEPIDVAYVLGLEPEQAVAYFKSKAWDFSFDWYDMWQEAHTKAFTVAKAMQVEVLDDIRGWVDKAIKDGITLQEFTKGLTPMLQNRGWWGKTVVDSPKGGLAEVELGSPTRLETIYRTNTQVAYNVGRYREQAANVDDRPYWQYIAVLDSHTRPTHAALNGKVFKATDPFWHTHYPPNGFNCRCRVRALTKEQVTAKGLEVYDGTDKLSEAEVEVAKGVSKKVTVFKGYGINMAPDPGWSYNPGETDWQPNLPPHEPDLVKEYKKAIEGRGLGKGISAGDVKGLEDLLRNFEQETPSFFKEPFKGVRVLTEQDFRTKDEMYMMATDSRGLYYLVDHDFPEYDNWNPAKDLFKAMDKINRGKKLDFNQEYSVEALWHEMLHNRARGKFALPDRSFNRVSMETVNQFVARHTYPEFLLDLGGLEALGGRVLKEGYGYYYMVRNLRTIMKAAGLSENNLLEPLRQLNTYQRWDGMTGALAETLAREFGDVRWKRQFMKILTFLPDFNDDGLPQKVRKILLED